jgi:hypothetical protein
MVSVGQRQKTAAREAYHNNDRVRHDDHDEDAHAVLIAFCGSVVSVFVVCDRVRTPPSSKTRTAERVFLLPCLSGDSYCTIFFFHNKSTSLCKIVKRI